MLRSLYDVKVLFETLKDKFDNGSTSNFVLERSYRHQNGFIKIVFPSIDERFCEHRLHIWEAGGSDCDIHNHSSKFNSFVISGSIEETIWEEAKSGVAVSKYKYVSQNGPSMNMEFMENTYVSRKTTKHIRSGHAYAIENNTIHKICNSNAHAKSITFVDKYERCRSYSHIFRRPYDVRERIPHVVDKTDVARYIECAINEINILHVL